MAEPVKGPVLLNAGLVKVEGESVEYSLVTGDGSLCVAINLPTTDPGMKGALWNDGGIGAFSKGASGAAVGVAN